MKRLPWQGSPSGGDWLVAYPDGPANDDRAATVRYTPAALGPDKWQWSVFWQDRFGENGHAIDRQAAADAATEAWWRLVATTEPPRDIAGEIASILDRIGAPSEDEKINTLISAVLEEDSDYLRRVLWQIEQRWRQQIRHDNLPAAVAELMNQTSRELFRRRTSTKGS